MLTTIVRDWLLDPLGLLVLWTLALCLGAALLRRRRGRRRRAGAPGAGPTGRYRGRGPAGRLARALGFVALWYAGLAAVSAPAIVNPLVGALEGPVPAGDCPAGTTVVALGGGADADAADATRFEAMDGATFARVVEAGRLAAAEPDVRVVVAGGGPDGAVPEAELMAAWLRATGVARERIVLERRSRSTAENARAVAASLAGTDAVRIRLVSSALHLPRALGAFRAAGFEPCPVPVDRLAVPDVPAWALWPQTTALAKFDRWLHEALALALYRRRGDLAPAPGPTGPAAPQTS